MRVLKFPHGEVRFVDCIEGMKELDDKSFDLVFTDPPFNLGYNQVPDRNVGRKSVTMLRKN